MCTTHSPNGCTFLTLEYEFRTTDADEFEALRTFSVWNRRLNVNCIDFNFSVDANGDGASCDDDETRQKYITEIRNDWCLCRARSVCVRRWMTRMALAIRNETCENTVAVPFVVFHSLCHSSFRATIHSAQCIMAVYMKYEITCRQEK